MSNNLENLVKKVEELFDLKKYQEVIELLTDEVLEEYKNAQLYTWLAGAQYRLSYDADLILLYAEKALKIDPDYFLAYMVRGNGWTVKGEYGKAIEDYTKVIELNPGDYVAYNSRGITKHNKGEFDNAILDYNESITLNPEYAFSYYYRGFARRNIKTEFGRGIEDFRKYLILAPDKDDIWAIRAKDYIKELNEKIADAQLNEIGNLTSEIKKILLIKDGCITHYTSLSTTKILILEENSRFRISEGAFLNDTSEGTELFKFLNKQFYEAYSDRLVAETFAPKPFIGSFVAEDKHDDLNLWRFYGKEDGTEAKGCAITIRIVDFIEAINKLLTEGHEKQGTSIESDISFYKVAYWDHSSTELNVIIPNSLGQEDNMLKELMQSLKIKVEEYKQEDRSILEKYLNSIAFLFKSDVYKNENEIRLVIKGIEFEKKIAKEISPPRVYIDLVNIRHLIKQITLGPKVDKAEEWAAAFHYSYDRDTVEAPKILISRLPYK